MGEYFIGSDGELYHRRRTLSYIDLDENEFVHFKYIKREKLPNGKWRYYYDSDQLKEDVKKVIGIGGKARMNKAAGEVRVSQKNEKITGKAFNDAMSKLRWDDQTSVDNWNKAAEDHKRQLENTGRKLDEYTVAKDEYKKSILGSIDYAIHEGKKALKDKLGYDERQRYENASKKYAKAQDIEKEYHRESEAVRSELKKEKNLVDPDSWELQTGHLTENPDWLVNQSKKAKNELDYMRNEYMNTPLGKLERAKDSIESAKQWVDDLFNGRKNKRK